MFSVYKGSASDSDDVIVPLLRFSVPTRAEQQVWLEAIGAGAAVHSPAPAADPAAPGTPAKPRKGVLAPIYFGDSNVKVSTAKDSARSKSKNIVSFQPSRPMHRVADVSYLSEGSEHNNYRGFLNLAFIILVVSNVRPTPPVPELAKIR